LAFISSGKLKMLARPSERDDEPDHVVRGQLARLLEVIDAPAFILGRRTDVLAWNPLGNAIFGFSRQARGDRNSARYVFTNPRSSEVLPGLVNRRGRDRCMAASGRGAPSAGPGASFARG